MSTLVWILLAVSSGSYNQGNATVLGLFASQQECEKVSKVMNDLNGNARGACVFIEKGFRTN